MHKPVKHEMYLVDTHNVIDFTAVYDAKQTEVEMALAAHDDECARRARLDTFLSDLLIELEAA